MIYIMNKVIFFLANNFNWDNYERKVYSDIIHANEPVEVIWNLSTMTNIPSFYTIMKQVNLMKKEKIKIKENITKNTVIVSSKYNKNFLLWIFKYIYEPENPTIILSIEDLDITEYLQ